MTKTKSEETGKFAARVALWSPGKIAVTQTKKGNDGDYHIDKDHKKLVKAGDNTGLAIAIWEALNGTMPKFSNRRGNRNS